MNALSIIIPTLNEEEQIGELVDTLFQRGRDCITEVIIADGGSSDRTVQIAEEAGAKTVHCRVRGRGRQMNKGAEAATGSILYFLHADSTPPDGFAQMICHSVEQGAEAGCFRLRFDDPHPLLRFLGWCTRFDLDLIRFGDQSLFITHSLFLRIGRYREDLLVMEDQEIIHRIRREGSFKLLGESIVTSARKYRKSGVFRLQMLFTIIWLGYYIGVGQKPLVRFYNRFIGR